MKKIFFLLLLPMLATAQDYVFMDTLNAIKSQEDAKTIATAMAGKLRGIIYSIS
jgi:hypothetical protein